MTPRPFSFQACLFLSLFVFWRLQTTLFPFPASSNNNIKTQDDNKDRDRLTGNLVLPYLPTLPYCINYQLRGQNVIMTSQQARDYYNNISLSSPLRTGIVTVEDPNRFLSLTKHVFHLYLFLEFLVLSFGEVHASSQLDVTWWYTPLLTRAEICGTITCQFLQYVLGLSTLQVHGLESNSAIMQQSATSWPVAYAGQHMQRAKFGDTYQPLAPEQQDQNHSNMLKNVDVLILIHREQCQAANDISKMWGSMTLSSSFSPQAWHDTVQTALSRQRENTKKEKKNAGKTSRTNLLNHHRDEGRLVVGYIDRQNTDRKIPDAFHSWLLNYLRKHETTINLHHVHMEEYNATTQVQIASTWDVIMGVHGNGLSHAVWMKPKSAVLEFYWDVPFKYSYPLAAQLWNHSYTGLYNGQVLNATLIQQHDPAVATTCCERHYPAAEHHWNLTASQIAVQAFVQRILQERGITSD